jgi:Na+-transporting NADH:ubiquinone oxidoreductase subunit A
MWVPISISWIPVHREKTVWHIDAQDVVTIGRLFTTGKISVERVVSLAGPSIKQPRLIRTRTGASSEDLVAGELKEKDTEIRVISGSVLIGRTASGPLAFLGRYHQQISALEEAGKRSLPGMAQPRF